MESMEKTVSKDNGQFRKCVYPYCRNMAMATDDYCELHQHSKLLTKYPSKKNPAKSTKTAPSPKVKKIVMKVLEKALTTPLKPAPIKKVRFLVTVDAVSRKIGRAHV